MKLHWYDAFAFILAVPVIAIISLMLAVAGVAGFARACIVRTVG